MKEEKEGRKEFSEFLDRIVKEGGEKAKKITQQIREGTIYGTKFAKVKIEQFDLENQKKELLKELGAESLRYFKKKNIDNQRINELIKEISNLDNKIRAKKAIATNYKKKI